MDSYEMISNYDANISLDWMVFLSLNIVIAKTDLLSWIQILEAMVIL